MTQAVVGEDRACTRGAQTKGGAVGKETSGGQPAVLPAPRTARQPEPLGAAVPVPSALLDALCAWIVGPFCDRLTQSLMAFVGLAMLAEVVWHGGLKHATWQPWMTYGVWCGGVVTVCGVIAALEWRRTS